MATKKKIKKAVKKRPVSYLPFIGTCGEFDMTTGNFLIYQKTKVYKIDSFGGYPTGCFIVIGTKGTKVFITRDGRFTNYVEKRNVRII